MKCSEIDWEAWAPAEEATLMLVIRDGQALLIHKLRGLGAGKINGPGGRIEPGETPRECAVRETQEEIGVTPLGVRYAGRLSFQFADGFSIRGYVFRGDDIEGTPVATEEAIPEWFPTDALPYDRMWADDRVWLPMLLAGKIFEARFTFDGDTMLDQDVREVVADDEQVSNLCGQA